MLVATEQGQSAFLSLLQNEPHKGGKGVFLFSFGLQGPKAS